MSALSLRLLDSLHNSIKKISKKEHISLNQFIATAVAEKMSALATEEYLLEKKAAKGNKKKYLEVLKKVPDVEPEERDRR